MTEKRQLRCAIYTRKSSENNLDLEFNSLHAQREAAEAYIKSQKHEGWRLIKTAYDDGGFSGGTLNRPALQQLLADVRAKKVDVVVVYKVDRLTRSLTDFSRLVELFDEHGVSFVSITQQFNTTNSMGRLTLNVLLSFAQFEREVAGERIRDKVAASRKKGMWMGGCPPLGYDAIDKKLVVNDGEAERVREIFRRYLACGCVAVLQHDLTKANIQSKRWVARTGREIGGAPISRGALYHLLRNRIYVGEVVHKGVAYSGEHPAILEHSLFDAVQQRLSAQRNAEYNSRTESEALLTGLLFDDRGHRMSPSWSVRRGARYRYYVSQALLQNRKAEAGGRPRIAAQDIEARVYEAVRHLLSTPNGEAWSLATALLPISDPDVSALRDPSAIVLVRACLTRIVLNRRGLELTWDREEVERRRREAGLEAVTNESSESTSFVPLATREKGSRPTLVGSPDEAPPLAIQSGLVKAIGKARSWAAMLESGAAADWAQLAHRAGHNELYVRRMIRLAWLAPDIVLAISEGRQPRGLTLTALLQPLPPDWAGQRRALGFPSRVTLQT